MRAVWRGTIGYGAFAIPVKVYGATEENSIPLNQVHKTDGGRIKFRKVCELDNEEVPLEDIAKGYQVPGGDVVMLTEDDFASLPLPNAETIEIHSFVPLDQIDPIYFTKSYYLEPEPQGTKPYVLLVEALKESGKVGIVRVALRQKETLGALRVYDQTLLLDTMLWPDEIRTPDFPFQYEDITVTRGEVRAAVALIDELASDFEPRDYADSYREALETLIQAKIEGSDLLQPTEGVQEAGVDALLASLRNSLLAADKAKAAAQAAKRANERTPQGR
ncbi:DNA end-binding protein Ku [Amycolatopsis xylanica]|uniref:Non-homologous end joining protein Ku n=1 Tax=Amycolatopsis xylanica TaxID=589385 RepID=A0A1H3R2A7_9PSEU|nr:Ku protein [Amycolatopsis xylanica]SDZ19962.1 DNA end-binding protein Ku [Amycolatopsis xylanica]